jgi:uncharacterized membrane protein YfcA
VDVGVLMLVGGFAAGLFGSLLGLGGGTLIVPLLTLAFGLDLRSAVGVSLVCVIMTSSAAAGVYLERHVANLRLGMSLELFTALGALAGGFLAFVLDERVLSVLFAALLGYVSIAMLRSGTRAPGSEGLGDGASADDQPVDGAGLETDTDLDLGQHRPAGDTGFIATLSGPGYTIRNFRTGVVGSAGAGLASALLGIGGGTIKVPLMHLAMGVPLRVATATSNLMMGITAAAGGVIYLLRGEIDPYVAGPTAVGVFLGATLGSRVSHRLDVRFLRLLFAAVLLYTAAQMLLRAAA